MKSSTCWPKGLPPVAAGTAALLYHDAVNHVIKGRKGARLTAITSGGAIPDTADYQVMLEPEGVHGRHAQRRLRGREHVGDIFQLGNSSYRILRVERNTVRVEDAKGERAEHSFLVRRSAGTNRTELSISVSRLREEIESAWMSTLTTADTAQSGAFQHG